MGILVGYGRCSTDMQDVAAQRKALETLGVASDRIYLDKGFTGRNRERPKLREALAACHDNEGDTLVVTKLDRLARSVPDARDIIESLHRRGVYFALGSQRYDWADPFSKMFLSMLAVFAEFEADLIRQRTREGMAIAKAEGRLKGKAPKLSPRQQAELVRQYQTGDYTVTDLAELWGISRPAVHRAIDRAGVSRPRASRGEF